MFSPWSFFGRRSVRALFHKASFISGKKFREGPYKHHVRRLGVPELERQLLPFYDVDPAVEILPEGAGMFSGYFICPRVTAGGSIFWSLMTIFASFLQ